MGSKVDQAGLSPELCPNPDNGTHAYAQMYIYMYKHKHTHRANNITENLETIKYKMAKFKKSEYLFL